jgi:UDP-N-acetylglucosamine 1-carboxyvinyltransferase
VRNVITKHLEPVTAKLREAGAQIEENGDYVRVIGPSRPKPLNVKTLPYPVSPQMLSSPWLRSCPWLTG